MKHISWAEYFAKICELSSQRSKDPNTKVGACIVDSKNRIIGIGYNGLPNGMNDKNFIWSANKKSEESKYHYVIHAELNAILNATSRDLEGKILYTTLFPCNECAKIISQSGIKKVFYLSDKYKDELDYIISKKIFKLTNVEFEKLKRT